MDPSTPTQGLSGVVPVRAGADSRVLTTWCIGIALAGSASAALQLGSGFAPWSGVLQVMAIQVALVAAWLDLGWRRIPNVLTYPVIGIGAFLHALAAGAQLLGSCGIATWTGSHGLVDGVVGLVAIGGGAVVVWTLRGMGGGDAKLIAALGAVLGLHDGWAALCDGLVFAGAFALLNYTLRGGLVARLQLAVTSIASAIMTREHIGTLSFERTEIPLGVPIFLGVATAPFWSADEQFLALLSRCLA